MEPAPASDGAAAASASVDDDMSHEGDHAGYAEPDDAAQAGYAEPGDMVSADYATPQLSPQRTHPDPNPSNHHPCGCHHG